MRDVQNLALIAAQSRKLLEQYERDVTRLVRRRYQFDEEISTTEGLSLPLNSSAYALEPGTPMGSMHGVTVHNYINSVPVEVTKVTTKSWFSGGFRFYYPSVAEGLEALSEIENNANTLLGTRLDPELLWNLQPWTWLLDWFVNTGSIAGNLSAILADNLVMQYGYIMRTVQIDKEITLPALWTQSLGGWARKRGPWSVHLSKTLKARAKASPFGFGLNPSDFSSNQWAILGALGISRGLR